MPAGGHRSARLLEPPSGLVFLNNYRGGGIGDFGAGLIPALERSGRTVQVEETHADGDGLSAQLRRVYSDPAPLIANVGLTAWGASGFRNFRGFRTLGRRQRAGRATIAIVHHAIEMFDSGETGYPISRLVRWGAHRALASLRGCDLIVFSPRLRDLLVGPYGCRSVWLTPMPSGEVRPLRSATGPWKVVTAGYLSPYKGIDTFLEVAEQLRESARFALIGRPHAVLSRRPEFAARTEQWLARARAAGVATPGYLPPEGLDEELAGRTLGVLAYTSASGASAAFGIFAERGVPVIASDLPEFRYLVEAGAGVVLARSDPSEIAARIRAVISDPPAWERLAERQRRFASTHTWSTFVADLFRRFPRLNGGG